MIVITITTDKTTSTTPTITNINRMTRIAIDSKIINSATCKFKLTDKKKINDTICIFTTTDNKKSNPFTTYKLITTDYTITNTTENNMTTKLIK